jgi:two-component system NtrC family response regulator
MDRHKLLVVEDEEAIQNQMRWALSDEYEVLLAGDRIGALEKVRTNRPPLILLDLGLPPSPRRGEEGLRALGEILAFDRETKVIVVTGNQDREYALKAIGHGAFDYFLKPADIDELKTVLKRALYIALLEKENAVRQESSSLPVFEEIIGESPSMQKVFELVRKVSATDVSVMIQGESGTGKELVARAIHRSGLRKDAPFVPINCGAIPENLLESELFGYEKGAFTGADAQKRGRIEYADGGTLFLDEVGELPLLLQVKLLRFLQEHKIERVGGRELIPVDVRVIAATNKDLQEEIGGGRFREDLYYRMGVVSIMIPPLRKRGGDAVLLAKVFLKTFSDNYRKLIKGFRPDALEAIESYHWPGNVRELENRVKRAVVMCEGKFVDPGDLELDDIRDSEVAKSLRQIREETEKYHVEKALEKHDGNISRAARELGVSRPTFHDLMRKYHLSREK